MTTAHHDPHAFGAPLTSAEVNRPLGQLDAAIAAAIVTGSGATTALTAQANSGQASLTVASSAGFAPGMSIWIGDPGGTFEVKTVDTVPNGTTITVTTNLANTYASGKPVSASPIELVDARGGLASLGTRLSLFDRWAYDVRKYGATGDGSTDDLAAIQAAVDAANAAGGGHVLLPPGTYRTTAVILLKTGVVLVGDGDNSIIRVDHTGTGVAASGSIAAGHSLAANAVRGTVAVTTSAGGGASYAAGDTVVIQSEAQAQSLAGLKKADIYRVLSVAGDVVTLQGALLDTYNTADTAKIRKVTPIERIGVVGLRIFNVRYTSAPTTATGGLINLELVLDAIVARVTMDQNNSAGISIKSCAGIRVEACRIQDLRDDIANSIYGYGIAVGHATRLVAIVGNTIRRVRHGFTTVTTSASLLPSYGVPRAISIVGNTITDTTHFGLDTHEDGDGIAIVGNTILACDYGGIQTRSWRTTIAGNNIFGCRGTGIRTDASSARTVISGNTITAIALDPAAGNGYGIAIDSDFAEVVGNYVFECATHGIAVQANANLGINVSGNIVMNNGQLAAATYDGLNINANIARATISGNSFLDDQTVKTQRYGIRIEAAYTNALGQGVHLIGNDLLNNATAPYSNAGAGIVTSWENSPGGAPGSEQRVKVTTGSIAASTTADVVVSLLYSMVDTNYVVSVVCEESTGNVEARAVKSKTATTVTVTVRNNDGGAAHTGTLHVLAVHD